MFAMYAKNTGIIQSTINRIPADPAQIAALGAAGYAYVEVPDNVNGSNAVIDVATGQPIVFNAPPAPVPNILVQYIAAQINAGILSADAFHPVTRAEMNAQLSAVNMATVASPTSELGAKDTVG